ncbi:hypothetical protein CC80DRAFT_592544 [Byssothecium circinans]|uniref:Uncharacterized protein n=1 Tax=Byssothecium circinans TaxID=147558 RepID=A0A6A5TYV3_9PLEO|nr:hypothetical protein CC80DRAFT_592544 [Byssothecium circinans]
MEPLHDEEATLGMSPVELEQIPTPTGQNQHAPEPYEPAPEFYENIPGLPAISPEFYDLFQEDPNGLGAHLVDSYRNDVFTIRRTPKGSKDMKPHLTANLAALNRMKRHKLRNELTRRILYMRYFKREPQGWEELLDQYIKAVKDDEFIQSCVERKLDDLFLIRTERMEGAVILRSWLNTVPAENREADGLQNIDSETFARPLDRLSRPIGGRREKTQMQKRVEKEGLHYSIELLNGGCIIFDRSNVDYGFA